MDHPSQLGKYPITAVLGEGAMGVVYRAHDPDIGREVALKTVHAKLLASDQDDPGNAGSDSMAARFRNEARAVGRLSHPGIVAIYEYGEDNGTAFIAMEYVEGKTLAQLLANGPPVPEPEILRLMDQLLDALECAHRFGVWHRDIKPANLILTASGRVKLTDFGIARIENAGLTLVNAQIGTPGYMAPEQYTGEGVDQRADLYACGVLLYRLLTGHKPFEGGAASVMFKVMNHDPVPPSQITDGIRVDGYDEIVARALARDPAGRFASAADFRRALAHRLEASLVPGSSITDMPTLLLRIPGMAAARGAEPTSRASLSAGLGGSIAKGLTGMTSASTALAPTGWDTDLLLPVERALAGVVGPMARVMVKHAARQSHDLQSLSALLVQQIDNPADRDRFIARLEAGTTHLTKSKTLDSGTTGSPSAAAAAPAQQLSEQTLAHATRVMTTYLGPIARIVVKKAAAGNGDPQRFFSALVEMADGVDKVRLLRELQSLH
ncbi:MAG: serine/threonine-protein kinase [Ideonella sp.]